MGWILIPPWFVLVPRISPITKDEGQEPEMTKKSRGMRPFEAFSRYSLEG